MQNVYRVFLDTSAILAGLNSPSGAAGVILAACFASRLKSVISEQVVEEAERILPNKFPGLDPGWIAFLLTQPEIVRTPSLGKIRRAYNLLPTNDAPILAAAIQSRPDALVTWNTRDFMRKEVIDAVSFPIFTPGDFLHWWRNV